ncbi:unnamed protein product [Scytosiphon promiscuus]
MAPLPVRRRRAPGATAAAVSYTAVAVAFTALTVLLTACVAAHPAAAAAAPALGAVPDAGGPRTRRQRSEIDAGVMKRSGEKAVGNGSVNDGGDDGRRLYKTGNGGGEGEDSGVPAAAARAAAAATSTEATSWEENPVERLIVGTGSSGSVFHLDLTLLERGGDGSSGGVGHPEDADGHSSSSSSSSEISSRNSTEATSTPPGSSGENQRQQQQQPPWFEGFTVLAPEAEPEAGPAALEAAVMTAAVTIGHPVRRLLSYIADEGVELEEALSWLDGPGLPANSTARYRRGYQLVDNFLVRVLGGRAAWELPPGGVGSVELTTARIALGKFEVILRQDCLSTDLALLTPYLNGASDDGSDTDVDKPSTRTRRTVRNSDPDDDPDQPAGAAAAAAAAALDGDKEEEEKQEEGGGEGPFLSLPAGPEGERLVRANRWDLQLWDFANELVASRSSTLEGFRCGSSKLAKRQRTLGEGRRAVVFNSPDFHLTGVSMFSCALVANGYRVTAVLRKPVVGYQQLLSCPDEIIILRDPPTVVASSGKNGSTSSNSTSTVSPTFYDRNPIVLSDTVAGMLGLSTATAQEEGQQQSSEGGEVADGDEGVVDVGEARKKGGGELEVELAGGGEGREAQGGTGKGEGGAVRGANFFDVSVMCTTYVDVNTLFDTVHNGMDPRLAEAMLWNVNTTIWNVHGVGRAFGNGSVPPAAHDFAARLPSRERERLGKTPPPTFLTVYGEHVGRWEQSLEEAYEGWGGGPVHDPTVPHNSTSRRPKVTNLRGVFRRPGVVYPIVPTGNLRLPRPNRQAGGDGGGGLFNIVASPSSSPAVVSFSSSSSSSSSSSWEEGPTGRREERKSASIL